MKNLKILLVVLSCFIALAAIARENCCSCNCAGGSCSVSGGASSCSCACDASGNPSCTIGSNSSLTICANSTQVSNLQGEVTLYQGFQTQEGNACATITSAILTLFANNNNYLSDNSQGGDVQTYEQLRNSLLQIQLTASETTSLNQYLNNCSFGQTCISNN